MPTTKPDPEDLAGTTAEAIGPPAEPMSSIDERISVHEMKARWCDEHGLPEDAKEHRAYAAQLRRRSPT